PAHKLSHLVTKRVLAPRDIRRKGHVISIRTGEAGCRKSDRADLVLSGNVRHGVGDCRIDARRVLRPRRTTHLGENPPRRVDYTDGDLRAPDVHSYGVHCCPLRKWIENILD